MRRGWSSLATGVGLGLLAAWTAPVSFAPVSAFAQWAGGAWTGGGVTGLTGSVSGVTLASGQFLAPAGTATAPSYSFAGQANVGLYSFGGSALGVAATATDPGLVLNYLNQGTIQMPSTGLLSWTNGTNPVGGFDLFLQRDSAGILALRGASSAGALINWKGVTAASVVTPAAGTGVLFMDSADKKLKFKDDAGLVSALF